jgi:exonuclease-1
LYNKGLENQARQKLIESIDINPKMAFNFIKELKRRNIEFFVAPYEADAQLAYLAKINYVDLVITEDSDLLALGCEKVLFKLNLETGFGFEIDLKDLPKCKDLDLTLFNHDKFLYYCILSGCDYFKLKGVGTKTAYQAVKERNNYKDMFQLLRLSSKNISPDCEDEFEKAFLTFKFQVIYCPIDKKMKHFNDFDSTIYTFLHKFEDKSFLGK